MPKPITTLPRLLVPPPLCQGGRATGTAAQARHLGTVLRRTIGDTVRLFDGASGEFAASIAALDRTTVLFTVGARLRPPPSEPERQHSGGAWLIFALLKRDATDLLVRQATELGVTALVPVTTARTQGERVNIGRLAAIAAEAAVQSERLTVPRIDPPQQLTRALGTWPADRSLVIAVERAAAPPLTAVPGKVALLVGPEGGWSDVETAWFRTLPFARPVSLGPQVLRAETAAIVGLAQLRADLYGAAQEPVCNLCRP